MSLVLGGVAFADDLKDNLEGSATTQTITSGGSVTVTYWIVANGSDGCNVDVDNSATMQTNAPIGVTASPSSLTFTLCRAANVLNSQSVTYSSNAPETYSIVPTISGGKGGNNGWAVGDAAFTLVVNPIADSTPPVITPTITGTLGDNGWYTSNVTVTFTVTDNESTITSKSAHCDAINQVTSDTSGVTFTCEATSAGGTASEAVTIKRDATAPTVSLVGGPADGGSYYFGSVPAEPTCSASDLLSGLDGDCTVSGYSNVVGTHTVIASASDNAGNVGSDSRTYTVLAWTTSGFYSPVDMNGTVNTIKGGQTVPLKFELFAGPTELKSTSYISYFNTKELSCTYLIGSAEDGIEITTTGATSLRFDATGDQFIQNWQTPKTTSKCYAATVGFQDGSSITGYFKTK